MDKCSNRHIVQEVKIRHNIKKKIFTIRANEKISPNKNIENQARNYNSGRFGDIYDTSYQWKERL